jgi:uncharacterized membrane protein (UPF0127 family)
MFNFRRIVYVFIIFALTFIDISAAQLSEPGEKEKRWVYFKHNSFLVDVAETEEQQEKGLMFVKSLPLNSGMLFIYREQAPRSFYMRNTYIPLDIIWIDKDKKVVFIKKDVASENNGVYETLTTQEEAMYVLELNAGSTQRIGLKLGDKLQF